MAAPIPIPPAGTPAQPAWILPALSAVLFLSLLPPPSIFRALIFIPPITYLIYLFNCLPFDPSDPTVSYTVSTLWTLHIRILLLHLRHLTTGIPPEDFYRPSQEVPDSVSSLPPWKKLGWINHIFISSRHIGLASSRSRYASSPKSGRSTTKWNFLFFYTLPRIIFCYLTLDAARCYVLTRPYSPVSTIPWAHTDPANAIPVQPPFWRVLDTLAFAFSAAAGMQLYYHFAAFSSVLVGLQRPEDWPPLFGTISEVSSVSDFWGKMWHRMLKPIIVLAWETLGVESDLGKIVVGFAISGAGHALCAWTYSGRVLGKGSAMFFAVQGVLVILDRVMGWTGGRKGWRRWAGMVWAIGVVTWTGAWIADDTVRGGMLAKGAVPGGIFMAVLAKFGVEVPEDR